MTQSHYGIQHMYALSQLRQEPILIHNVTPHMFGYSEIGARVRSEYRTT